ncbi:TetR/AcrR family transcriptional regulator C-terminal domain-containing protein [Microbacterium marinilacus]|uniref:TetR/AcrR family transcriptional regulator C-terminal domain-containing protein n=1 Tax=Microbacterium marinilacus TaxID=415209 RepID=A0ABP7BSB7_9MICO|nr:TetR/AcrR family transcriptional regulator C-terminal domain-containing protein [Microbacterium marinilacus]MBY0690466.1 TetR/AcrR family transcriptional regulator C-terminal domain-containing protein [Microbacterium marinilacus]
MTKKRLNREDVVRAALELLDDSGYDAVTLRGVAKHLGVHLNSVSFQITTKARLFELMAEAILGELALDDLPDEPRERISEVTRRLRRAMLSHRDGGRVIGGTDTADANAFRYAEVTIGAFLELGVSDVVAVRASFALHCLVIGLVEEEQADRPNPHHTPITAEGFPRLAGMTALLEQESYADRAEFGINALITQAVLTAAAPA